MSSPYGHSDKVWAEISDPKTICARLRGHYTIPVNDGAGPLNGSMTFSRSFQVAPIQVAAAGLIEAQAAEIERLREALRGVLSWAELAAGNDEDLTQHEAWDERRTIEIARAALQPKEGE